MGKLIVVLTLTERLGKTKYFAEHGGSEVLVLIE